MGGQPCAQCAQKSPVGTGMLLGMLAPIAGRAGVGALLHGAPTAGNAKGASVGALLHGAQSAGVGLLCVQPWVSKKSCQSASERFGWGLCFSLM